MVLDLFSRKIVGCSMGNRMTRELAISALQAAPGNANRPVKCWCTPIGVASSAATIGKTSLAVNRLRPSMSRRGNCHDNAVAQSFFQLLKRERIRRKTHTTRNQARADVFDYIELFYNTRPRHGHNRPDCSSRI